MLKTISIVVTLLLVLAGCQSMPNDRSAQREQPHSAPVEEQAVAGAPAAALFGAVEPELSTAAEQPPSDLWERIRGQLSWQSIHNAQVGKARDRFLRQPDYLSVVAERAALYLYYIVDEVERRGLPMELALLPLVESTLNPFA